MLVVKERVVENQSVKLPSQAKSYDDLDKTTEGARNPWASSSGAHDVSRPQAGGLAGILGESPTLTKLVLLGSGLLFFADGIQAAFGDFVYTYGKLTIDGLDISDAALVNASFWVGVHYRCVHASRNFSGRVRSRSFAVHFYLGVRLSGVPSVRRRRKLKAFTGDVTLLTQLNGCRRALYSPSSSYSFSANH